MYKNKNRIKNNSKKKFKVNIGYFEFSISGFSNSQDERVGNSNNILFDLWDFHPRITVFFNFTEPCSKS